MNLRLKPRIENSVITLPPSKSIAHRMLICAAFAQGKTRIQNISFSEDIEATIRALRAFGVTIEKLSFDTVCVTGMQTFHVPNEPVDCGESGSTLRFLITIAALMEKPVTFVGQGRLLLRPQETYQNLFQKKGVLFSHTAEKITVCGPLQAGKYYIKGNLSSQFATGLLFALSRLEQPSEIIVEPPFTSASYVALTVDAMRAFGVDVQQDGNHFFIHTAQKYQAGLQMIEGDWSQAAFFAVVGSVRGNVRIAGLRLDSVQGDRVLLDILKRCGAKIQIENEMIFFEKSPLFATEIDLADCPDLGPALMALALFCEGTTKFYHTERLRIKESDRVLAMKSEIEKMGGKVICGKDEVFITKSSLHTAILDSHHDHRIAMAMAAVSMASGIPITMHNADAVKKSYQNFWNDCKKIGCQIEYKLKTEEDSV